MKKIEEFFSLESSYDRKHILNTCNKKVPQNFLDEIESGVTIEKLEEMMRKKFDVFKYKTQITIHGLFDSLSVRRIGGYVNLTQNKNLSIGVRYTAIDFEKKHRLYNLLKESDGWCIERNSQKYTIYKMEKLPYLSYGATEEEKENYLSKCKSIVEKFRDQANGIDKSLFVGHVDCYLAESMFGKYIVLDVNILTFYEKNLEKIFENLSGKTFAEGQAIAEQKRQEKEAERKAWEEKYEKERQERAKKDAENKEKFLAENVLSDFEKIESFEPQIGDVYAILSKDWSGDYKWSFFTITKHAGRLLAKPCDEKGEIAKYAKGTVMNGKISADYLKRETPKETFEVTKKVNGKLFIQNLSNGTFLLSGETYPHRHRIKELGGKWNKWQKSWAFTKSAEQIVRKEFCI